MNVPAHCYLRFVSYQQAGPTTYALQVGMIVSGKRRTVTLQHAVTVGLGDVSTMEVPEGELISAQVTSGTSAVTSPGDAYLILELWAGAPTGGVKIGVVGARWNTFATPQQLYPGIAQPVTSLDRMPYFIGATTPAAGAEIVFAALTAYSFGAIAGFNATLTTDATAANRTFGLEVLEAGGQVMGLVLNNTAMTASTATICQLGNGPMIAAANNNRITAPARLIHTRFGASLTTRTANIQAADQWSAGSLLCYWVPRGLGT